MNKLSKDSDLKTNFKENYLDIQNKNINLIKRKYQFMSVPHPLQNSTYPFVNNPSLPEFLKYNGIKYLTLHLTYFQQVISLLKINSNMNENALTNAIVESMYLIYK
jgi:hypothetical protein